MFLRRYKKSGRDCRVGRQNSRTFWRSRVAAICPADSFVTAKGFIADSREHLMWQWLEPHDLYWRRVSSKMHSHLHTKDNQGECFVPLPVVRCFPRCVPSSPSECKDLVALSILYSRQLEDLVGNYSAQSTNTCSIVQVAKKL